MAGWIEHPNLEVVTGDVRDPHFCKHITKDVEIVFHLAALIAIPYSYVAPDSYVDTNVKGTLNICQAAKREWSKTLYWLHLRQKYMEQPNTFPLTKSILNNPNHPTLQQK
jgi:UDP-glucose 4-epimerase